MAQVILNQQSVTLVKDAVKVVMPTRTGRTVHIIQAPPGVYWVGLNEDPVEDDSLCVSVNEGGRASSDLLRLIPLKVYEGDIRVLYTKGPATARLFVLEMKPE